MTAGGRRACPWRPEHPGDSPGCPQSPRHATSLWTAAPPPPASGPRAGGPPKTLSPAETSQTQPRAWWLPSCGKGSQAFHKRFLSRRVHRVSFLCAAVSFMFCIEHFLLRRGPCASVDAGVQSTGRRKNLGPLGPPGRSPNLQINVPTPKHGPARAHRAHTWPCLHGGGAQIAAEKPCPPPHCPHQAH